MVKDADALIRERGEYFESKCVKENDPQACENAVLYAMTGPDDSKQFKAAERCMLVFSPLMVTF